jgi:hypothetical protein
MVRWPTIARFAVLCLLFLTGFELFACELMPSSICELSGAPLDTQQEGGDSCLCCCFHVIPLAADPPLALTSYVHNRPAGDERVPFRTVPSLELPPRA